MIKLWRHIIRPLVEAVDARTILEIGAEYGSSTKIILKYIRGVNGHLHCIDPSPSFDTIQFEEENKEHLTYYDDLSLNVLGEIPCFDVALVDGDHNWYTVYNELKLIEQRHERNASKFPVILLHDTGWPYGRRDLYYDPGSIPDQFLHPYARKGISIRDDVLVDNGGMNSNLYNAVHSGSPKNGVLTGVEDYIKESTMNFRFLNIPLYYGLGILVTEEQLNNNSRLAARVSHLESLLKNTELVELGEHMRLTEAGVFQNMHRKISQRMLAAEARVAELEALINDTESLPR